jgi:hypothetical protein
MQQMAKPTQPQISLDDLKDRRDLTVLFSENELREVRDALSPEYGDLVDPSIIERIDGILLEREVWLAREICGYDAIERLASGAVPASRKPADNRGTPETPTRGTQPNISPF